MFLLAAIVLAAGTQAFVAYRTVLKEADDIFDHHMQQMALSLRAGLPPSSAVGGLGGGEENFEFVVQVWTLDGVRIFESAAQAALPQRAVLGFANVRARGTTYRVFSLADRAALVIQVAQDMAARRHMAGTLALRTVRPVALTAPLLMLVVWWVVSRSLAPVARVRRQVARRQADDLSPVSEEPACPTRCARWCTNSTCCSSACARPSTRRSTSWPTRRTNCARRSAALKLQVQGLQRATDEATRELAVATAAGRRHRPGDPAGRADAGAGAARGQRGGGRAAGSRQPARGRAAGDLRRRGGGPVAATSTSASRRPMPADGAGPARGAAHAAAQPDRQRGQVRRPGGRVDLAIAAEAGRVELSVDDSGPGLPASERERVLDRFYRAGQPQAPGSGLGLSIVKSIADLHGATVVAGARRSPRRPARSGRFRMLPGRRGRPETPRNWLPGRGVPMRPDAVPATAI